SRYPSLIITSVAKKVIKTIGSYHNTSIPEQMLLYFNTSLCQKERPFESFFFLFLPSVTSLRISWAARKGRYAASAFSTHLLVLLFYRFGVGLVACACKGSLHG